MKISIPLLENIQEAATIYYIVLISPPELVI